MADLATITIPVDSSAMVRAVKDAKNLERGIKMLVDAFDSGTIGSQQLSKGLLQLKRQYEGLFGTSQKATASVRGHAKSLQESKAAALAATAAEERLTLAKKKAETAYALGLQRAREEERQLVQTQAEILRLESMYNKVSVAARVYQQAQESLSRAVALGVISADQQEAKLAELSVAYQKVGADANKAQAFINRFGENAQVSGRGLNQFGMYAQQVGYQVGDFLVQIQSGTNFLVAFGQQATQLAGLFPGVLGAALGIGISLATAIGAAFMRTREGATSAAEGILTLADAQKQLNEASGDYALKLEMLRFGVDTQAEAVALKSILDLTKQIRDLNKEYQETDSLSRRQAIAEEVQALKAQLSAQQEIVDEVNAKKEAYEKALAINEQMLAVELGHARAAGQTAAAAKKIDFSSAVSSAAQLAQQLGISVSHASRMLAMGFGKGKPVVFDPRDPNYNPIAAEMERIRGDYGSVSPFDPSRQEKALRNAAGGAKKLKDGLEEATKAAEELRRELEAPLVNAVGSISDAFGDFVARGLRDFKGFVKSILGSFQNMIAQMIAMAVKNRIMLSLGIGGLTPGMAAAGQVAGLGSAGGILGSIGIGKGVAGLAGGTGFLGGAANTISGLAGGGAGLLNVGANAALAGGGVMATLGAAMPIIGVGLALFSLFKKKPIIKPEDLKKVNDALDMTGQKLNLTGKEAQLAARELGKLAGGFDELSKKANFFFENFYTASEQQAMATTKAQKELNKVFKELGVSIPNTHEEYRQLVEAQDLTTESGRKMYTALLDVSGAFVTLRGSAEQAAQFMAQQSAAVNESVAQRKLGEFFDREFQARQIENVGTTLEQNDYLMNQLVEDYNKYVERFNDSLKGLSELDAPRLKPIDRQTLESMTDIDERLAEALGKTSKLQGTLLNWYEGVLKTSEDISNMIFEFVMSQGLGTVKAKGAALDYKRRGELPEGFLENFGKFGLFERLPYIFEVTQFVNDQILIFEDLEGNLRTTLEGLGRYADSWGGVGKAMADLNASFTGLGPTIANAGEMIGKISGLVVSAFESIRKGYEKIIEATDKVRTFFKDEFAALAQEYAKDTQLTQSTKVVERIEKVLEAPARLLDRLDYLMKKLDKKSDVAFSAIRSTEQTIRTLTASGQEVSEELRSSYSQMERSFREAREAGRKAREEIQKIRLFIETVSTATNEFVSAVEKMAVAPIEEGLKFFEPAMFSQMGDNVRRGMIDIFSALSEGGYEAFERGFVQLTDLLASEAITVDQFNNSFKIMRDVFLGNISLTDEYTTRQQTVVEKLSKAYGELTDVLDSALSIVRGGINALIGQLTAADVVANRRASTAYLQSVARTGQFDTTRLESAVGAVTSGDITGFGTRQEFARYIAITTQLLQSVEGTLGSQLDTLQMQQVKAILNIQDTSESAATSLQSISQLLSEFLGVGGRIPAFASGGYHTGGLRLVGENGPEIEATGPARIFSNREISVGDNSGLKQEIQGLRQDLNTALVQIAKNTRKSADTLNKFDYQGMPQDRDY